MSNYLIVHVSSNLVTGIVSSSSAPTDSVEYKFLPANERAISVYLNYITKQTDRLPDVGEILARCEYLNSIMIEKHSCKLNYPVCTPKPIRYRNESIKTSHENRESTDAEWIRLNTSADVDDLCEVFCCGSVTAKAYLSKYRV